MTSLTCIPLFMKQVFPRLLSPVVPFTRAVGARRSITRFWWIMLATSSGQLMSKLRTYRGSSQWWRQRWGCGRATRDVTWFSMSHTSISRLVPDLILKLSRVLSSDSSSRVCLWLLSILHSLISSRPSFNISLSGSVTSRGGVECWMTSRCDVSKVQRN